MTRRFRNGFRAVLLGLALMLPGAWARGQTPSFADFDRRAAAGEALSVVFFGASLTWGANATDPMQTSYRAQVSQRLQHRYPKARFQFWDAAIGGTGSQLGVFRLDRDVLSRKPDLVFLDFSANDGLGRDDAETMGSYESLVRRIVAEGKAPVVQMLFAFMWDVQSKPLEKLPRRTAHLRVAEYYQTAVGDAIALAKQRVASGSVKLEDLWPFDGVHPGDAGYALFADAAMDALTAAVADGRACTVPEQMLFPDTYMHSRRTRLSQLADLPAGWSTRLPNRTSAYFDMMMSRWLDDVVVANGPATTMPAVGNEPIKIEFRGRMVLLFGESTEKSGKYRIVIDGKPVFFGVKGGDTDLVDVAKFARQNHGNVHHVQILATGLDPAVKHTVEIHPILASGEELRLESICIAGGESPGPIGRTP